MVDENDGQAPWYQTGLSFDCTGCGDCCSGAPGAVWLNDEEQRALAAFLGLEVGVFQYRYTRHLGLRRALHERSSGDCCFFDPESKKCVVYEARPVQCRTYPFWDKHVETAAAWARLSEQCEGARQEKEQIVRVADIRARARSLRLARAKDRRPG